jgi:hypothetical protein
MTTRSDEGEKLRRDIGRRESTRGPLLRDVRERCERYAAARAATGASRSSRPPRPRGPDRPGLTGSGQFPHRASRAALGFASNASEVWSAIAATNPALPLSSPTVWYQVVLPPA